MIYACQHCGAWFSSDEINKASKNRDAVITCSFCGYSNEFFNPNASRLSRGYNALEEGDFSDAINVFTMEIEENERKGKAPSPDAFLGLSLARFGVRTVFDSTDVKRMGTPLLSCWEHNNMYLADDENYLKAMRMLEKHNSANDPCGGIPIADITKEKEKLGKIQDHVDALKDYYEQIKNSKRRNSEYGVFIAFDDESNKAAALEMLASKVKNALPKVPVFMPPDRTTCENDIQYEARLLYALHHSKCMLVLVGDNPSTRLRDMYTWYYHHGHKYDGASGVPGKNLGFIFHNVHIPIMVPNGTVDRHNMFEMKEPRDYERFVCRWNNILVEDEEEEEQETKQEEAPVLSNVIASTETVGDVYEIRDDHHLAFGHYPQSQEKSLAVTQHFAKYERPDKTDNRGWTVLFRNHDKEPYTWYRDDTIDGVRYRAVYFTRFREKCTIREAKDKNTLQKEHGYVLRTLYCFRFDPIIWDVEKIKGQSVAVLVSERGLDCRSYNNIEMDNEWECCSMHTWLNEEFLENAFGNREKKILCHLDRNPDDKVFLMDKEEDRMFVDRHNSIAGSDYYKCLGGMGDRCISKCWITDKSLDHNGEASVIYPTTSYTLDRVKVDTTSVAVLPKVLITLKSGDEKRFSNN